MKTAFSFSLIAAFTIVLTACGSGSDSSENPAPPHLGKDAFFFDASLCIEAPTTDICEIEQRIAVLVNEYRQRFGRAELILSAKVSYVSRDWSKRMARSGNISHDGFSSARYSVLRAKFGGSDLRMQRENVAMFSAQLGTPEAIATKLHKMWINSPGHEANISSSGISNIGVGVYRSGSKVYATQIFGNGLD